MRVPLRFSTLLAIAALALAGCRSPAARQTGAVAPAPAVPEARVDYPPGWPLAAGAAARAVSAPNAMVVSNSEPASAAGVEILREGGNAVDAAVATGFALAVSYPQAGNLGGGGFMVIRMADGRRAALDYREIAPLSATRDMYVDGSGHLTDKGRVGPLASGVPGAVAGMAEALRKYGTLSLSTVLQPAIRLAAEGFVVDSTLSRALADDHDVLARYAAGSVFFPGGHPIAPGTRLVQPELARTLRLIAERGPSAFYTGPVGDSLVAEMQRDGGNITAADLARYRALWREPIVGTYRGDTIIAMPPSSSGGTTTVESLNILEGWPSLPPAGSAGADHLVAEAFRRAFVDRNTALGDPAFVQNPIARLTSKAYADTLRATILAGRASKSPTFGGAGRESMQTTHYSVVDAHGNAVATTTTLNSWFGSGVYLRSTGFFLNNEMDDFTSQPGTPNQFGLVQGEANAIAPGKRMLSAMSPTVVVGRDGRVLLVVGAAGGPTIITATTQIILNVVDHHMTLADAMAFPRIHQQAWPDKLIYEKGGLSPAVADSLQAMGYELYPVGHLANANAIVRTPTGWTGVVEPRATGGAVGY